MWNFIGLKENKFFLSIAISFNDFEINNPLGSRKSIHKLDAVYLSLLGLLREYSSNLDNILFVQPHNYEDHKKLGNKIFSPVVGQIIDLKY